MTLEQGRIGAFYRVSDVKLTGITSRRLEALGLTQGTTVEMLNHKGNGSIIFKVRGTRLAVGMQIAEAIMVEEVAA